MRAELTDILTAKRQHSVYRGNSTTDKSDVQEQSRCEGGTTANVTVAATTECEWHPRARCFASVPDGVLH
jgi:hypothetical protein